MRRKVTFWVVLACCIIGICLLRISQNAGTNIDEKNKSDEKINGEVKLIGEMELKYATQFQVKYYEGGYKSIIIADGNSYVIVPKGGEELKLSLENPTYIHMPCDSIYLAASSAMDLVNELDALDCIQTCSTKAEDYSVSSVREKIELKDITYVGKYSTPDYESLLLKQTDLAIESTMIYHSPKIKEELEKLGIPVLVERSSYESNPLGRLEWIKLYGVLTGKEELANEIFEHQMEEVSKAIEEVKSSANEKKKVVFFYISSNGYVNVRKPGDYISKMIELAGGEYALKSLPIDEENALSTVNISWEDFYVYAKDADILIYNGTIDGGISNIDELLKKSSLIGDFRAVKENMVFCTNNNMYQETSKVGDIIVELSKVIRGEYALNEYINAID